MGCFCKQAVTGLLDDMATQQIGTTLALRAQAQAQANLSASLAVKAGLTPGFPVAPAALNMRQAALAMLAGQVDVDLALSLQVRAALSLQAKAALQASASASLVASASLWLSARWLPAEPFVPDPAWLDVVLPQPPLPAEALAVILGLIQAHQQCSLLLGLNLTETVSVRAFARIVTTLNARLPSLAALLEPALPWGQLAGLNAHADRVLLAASAGLFASADVRASASVQASAALSVQTPIAPWRSLVTQLKALAPLIAIGQLLKLNLAEPDALAVIADLLRQLRMVQLPKLADPQVALRLIAQMSATAQLSASLGCNVATTPFPDVVALVLAKLEQAAGLVPVNAHGVLQMPPLEPNPSTLVTSVMVNAALKLSVRPLNWSVPAYGALPLLVTGAPVLALVAALGGTMTRSTPCGQTCDAAKLMRVAA